MNSARIFVVLGVVAVLMGCSSSSDDEVAVPEEAEVLYNKARDSFDNQEYKKSVQQFEEVERQHPYSEWATRAQIMAGYANYRAGEFDNAVAILQRFVKLHPNSESTPYAFYLIALCYYDQISDVGRDQKMTEEALQALKEVVTRFPQTEYARDARIKMDLTNDHLAGKEMEIGRYYLKRQEYLAAINRFKYVVDNYQTTSHTPEALHRLVESYLALGVKEEAQRYAAVLGHNFPGSNWYRYSYNLLNGKPSSEGEEKGIVNRILKSF